MLLCCLVGAASASFLAQAQTPTSPPTQGRPGGPAVQTPARPPTPAAQAPAPTRRPAPAPPARGGVSIQVTDLTGAPLRDVRVVLVGPTERSGTTDSSGQLRITGIQAGTYRVRFTNDSTVEFEKEVAVRGGPNVEVDVSLRPAPPPVIVTTAAPPPPAPIVISTPTGPVGQPQTVSIPDLVTKSFLEGARKEVLISCSANTRTTLVQMSSDQSERLYDKADVTYYVIGGEGAVRIGLRETAVKLDSFISVPRGTSHSVLRRGRRPLIFITQLSGEPCEQAK